VRTRHTSTPGAAPAPEKSSAAVAIFADLDNNPDDPSCSGGGTCTLNSGDDGCNGTPEDPLMDACGVCSGDGASCADCAGTPGGAATEDACGLCNADPADDCQLDCTGACVRSPDTLL
jgi:hypothetical protein